MVGCFLVCSLNNAFCLSKHFIKIHISTVKYQVFPLFHLHYPFQDLKGMTGELAAHRADLAATIMAQCCERHQVMDYTVPIEFRRFWIYFRQPELAIDIYFTQVEKQFSST